MQQPVYKHTFPIQLRWNDADQFGHINNTIYLQYYDTAKIEYFRSLGLLMDAHHAIVAVHIEADFIAQVYTNSHVAVQTSVVHIGHKSFTLAQQLIDADTHEIKCKAETIMVAYNLEEGQSVALWPDWKDKILKFENHVDLSTKH